MTRRPLLAAALASALVAALGAAHDSAAAPRRPRITIGKATISPTKFTGAGGTTTVNAIVTASGGAVVHAVVIKSKPAPGKAGASTSTGATPAGGNKYRGSLRVGPNLTTVKTTVEIWVEVTGSTGLATKKVGVVTLDKSTYDPSLPPPPPPI